MLGREEIAALLPHAGDMLLIDAVAGWTDDEISCVTRRHRRGDNPLRRDGLLPAVCGVEFGAQAMAIHGALLSDGKRRPGVLASLRDVRWQVDRLDDVEGDLDVSATVMLKDRNSFIYAFRVGSAGAELLGGRAAVFLL